MSYKTLYLEDCDANSTLGAFKAEGLNIELNNASSFDKLFEHLQKCRSYDAYILDYRLTTGEGKVDAPTYASMIRTAQSEAGGGSKLKLQAAPIILISTEDNLSYFEKDFTSQDLFDLVAKKPSDKNEYGNICNKIKALVDGYKRIQEDQYNLNKILEINDSDAEYIGYHLREVLEGFQEKKDTYAFCRIIYQTVIRSSGLLVGEDILAARLGVDKKESGESWTHLKEKLSKCKYEGIFSSAYDRWWMHRVLAEWQTLHNGTNLRRLTAKERVEVLNSFWFREQDKLIEAAPIEKNSSTCFWTICAISKEPLDPTEGYLYQKRDRRLWEEHDYASLYALLEFPNERAFVSPLSKSELDAYE